MLQGTGSDVGKSLLLTGMARAFTRRGLKVRPFKPQNMSNNAAVTADGGEIGRAQALQARACGVEPLTDMNPVLLKPQSESGAQIVLDGRVWGNASAGEYRRLAPSLLPSVLAAFARLAGAADLVLVEGAGSPAEINLRSGDIANMGFAEAVDLPVVLIGDIERGGVIAQLVGYLRAPLRQRTSVTRRLHRQQIPRRYSTVRRRDCGARRAHWASLVRHSAVLPGRLAAARGRFAGARPSSRTLSPAGEREG